MKRSINEFTNFIKERTSINLSVYDVDGKLIVGDKYAPQTVRADLAGVFCDDEENATVFPITLSGKELLARIDGTDGYVIKLAKLILELARTYSEKSGAMSKKQFFSALLKNQLSFSAIEGYVKKFSVPDKKCFVSLVLVPEQRTDEVEGVIEDYIETGVDVVVKVMPDTLAVVRFFTDGDNEYKSATEYADFLLKSVYEECGIKGSAFAGTTVKSPYSLSTSYSLALEAKDCAEILGGTASAHSFKEYVLTKAVRELPPVKTDEYYKLLEDDGIKSVFRDSEIIETAEAFLDCNLNASETARKLYVHRNTLMYRLDKIEKATGLNIRNFSHAVTFRFMTILYKAGKM